MVPFLWTALPERQKRASGSPRARGQSGTARRRDREEPPERVVLQVLLEPR